MLVISLRVERLVDETVFHAGDSVGAVLDAGVVGDDDDGAGGVAGIGGEEVHDFATGFGVEG